MYVRVLLRNGREGKTGQGAFVLGRVAVAAAVAVEGDMT
jgi:hypothetical protein